MIHHQRILTVFFLSFIPLCCAGAGKNTAEFVARIYDQYQTRRIPDLLGPAGDTIFTPIFLEKYRALSKKSPDRHVIGWDPLCWCDDAEFPGYAISEVKLKMLVNRADYAEVDVLLKISGFGQGGVLILKKISGRWLIDDIRSTEILSLKKYIEGLLDPKRIK